MGLKRIATQKVAVSTAIKDTKFMMNKPIIEISEETSDIKTWELIGVSKQEVEAVMIKSKSSGWEIQLLGLNRWTKSQ